MCSACQWLTVLLVICLSVDLTDEIKLCLISVKYQIVIFLRLVPIKVTHLGWSRLFINVFKWLNCLNCLWLMLNGCYLGLSVKQNWMVCFEITIWIQGRTGWRDPTGSLKCIIYFHIIIYELICLCDWFDGWLLIEYSTSVWFEPIGDIG